MIAPVFFPVKSTDWSAFLGESIQLNDEVISLPSFFFNCHERAQERESKREKKRERDLLFVHSLVASYMCSDQGLNPQLWRTGTTF